MENLALWVIVAAMTPACFNKKAAEYNACLSSARQNPAVACVAPAKERALVSLGKLKIEAQGVDELCYSIKAFELTGSRVKSYSLKEWNNKSEPEARPVTIVGNK